MTKKELIEKIKSTEEILKQISIFCSCSTDGYSGCFCGATYASEQIRIAKENLRLD